jgi:hypothetical protein
MRTLRQCFIADAGQVNGTGAQGLNHYFIVGPMQVVAQDLAYSIRICDPAARIDCFATSAEALAALDGARPVAVLMHRDPAQFQTTPLGRALQARGIPHAFLGPLADGGGAEPMILESPFSDATVAALLQVLVGKLRLQG